MSASRRIAGNMLATLTTQLLSWVLSFAVMLFLPRYVGDVGLGKLTFAASFIAVFGVLAPLGTGTVLVTEIARDRSRTGELLLAALTIRIPLALMLSLLAMATVCRLGYPLEIQVLVGLSALGMIVAVVNTALASTLQGQEKMPRQSLAVLAEKFLASIMTVALIFQRAPLWLLASVGLVAGTVSVVINLTAFRSLLSTMRLPRRETLRYMAVAGLPFMGWTVFMTLYGQTDPIVLKLIANDASVGWYAAGQRLTGTMLFFPSAITAALLPTLSRLHVRDPESYRRLGRRMLGLVTLGSVPVSLILICLPERLLELMHYPAGFVHSIMVIRIGGAGVMLWSAACVLGTLVIAGGEQKQMFRASVLASLVGIPACVIGSWLTHRVYGNGAIGAMASDVSLELLLVSLYVRVLPQGTFGSESLSLLLRCLVASLPMALALWAAARSHWGLWALLPCGALYALMCLLLRCISSQDLLMVRAVLARKPEVS